MPSSQSRILGFLRFQLVPLNSATGIVLTDERFQTGPKYAPMASDEPTTPNKINFML